MTESRKISILMQSDQGRRAGDKLGLRRSAEIIMDEETRKTFGGIISETAAHAAAEAVRIMIEQMGVEPAKHADDHRRFDKIEEWVTASMKKEEALTRKADAQREFLQDTWKMGFFKPGLITVGWALILAVLFGLAKALRVVLPMLDLPS